MSGFLLDTHIWFWAAARADRLVPEVIDVLQSPESELWLSPLSVLEVHILAERGRITLPGAAGDWIRKTLAGIPVRETPLGSEMVLLSRALAKAPRDPIDRVLIATAATMGLTLITADRQIAKTSHCEVLRNRRRR